MRWLCSVLWGFGFEQKEEEEDAAAEAEGEGGPLETNRSVES
jgi:hypothetical protein